jgi:glycosyltransferase involved in cell wall biosynthesis
MAKAIKVLSIGSLGKRNKKSTFRKEQGESLKDFAVDVNYFDISGGGVFNYQKSLRSMKDKLHNMNYDIIHSHYGLSGMLSVLQRHIPVVITFHGSDIWQPKIKFISRIASYLSSWNIFISKRLKDHAKGFRRGRSSIVPCGVNLKVFYPMNKYQARNKMKFDVAKKYVLFSSSFDNKIKNYSLAERVVNKIGEVELIELKEFNKDQVNYLMNACDALLVTSLQESGPLVVKEAMACNLPVISTNVGDVHDVIHGTEGNILTTFDAEEIAYQLKTTLKRNKRTKSREKIFKFELNNIAHQIISIYMKVLNLT